MNFRALRESLKAFQPAQLVFVGLGNEICGDDGAGKVLLEKLAQQSELQGAAFIFAGTNPENYVHKIIGATGEAVIFIDTARFGAAPGTIAWLSDQQIINSNFSTHTFSPKVIADYITAHKPMQFFYLGIEPQDTGLGKPLSETIQEAIANFFN